MDFVNRFRWVVFIVTYRYLLGKAQSERSVDRRGSLRQVDTILRPGTKGGRFAPYPRARGEIPDRVVLGPLLIPIGRIIVPLAKALTKSTCHRPRGCERSSSRVENLRDIPGLRKMLGLVKFYDTILGWQKGIDRR